MYTSLITVQLALLFNYYFVSVTTLHWKSKVYIYIYIYIYKVLQVIFLNSFGVYDVHSFSNYIGTALFIGCLSLLSIEIVDVIKTCY
jgi:hypothetical protein